MKNQELLNELIECNYTPQYICLVFILNGESYQEWFLETIKTNKKYEKFNKALTSTIVDDFMKTMKDNTVNLNKYFRMYRVIERANIYKAKLHRIEVYAKTMKIDKILAKHIYLKNEKEAERALWDKICEESNGKDYKEKYPIRKK